MIKHLLICPDYSTCSCEEDLPEFKSFGLFDSYELAYKEINKLQKEQEQKQTEIQTKNIEINKHNISLISKFVNKNKHAIKVTKKNKLEDNIIHFIYNNINKLDIKTLKKLNEINSIKGYPDNQFARCFDINKLKGVLPKLKKRLPNISYNIGYYNYQIIEVKI